MAQSSVAEVSLRRLRWRDARFCWQLATDPDVREASLDPSPPTLLGHISWMADWVTPSQVTDRAAWVMEHEGKRAGLLRVYNDGERTEVSVAVMPWARGRGLATTSVHGAAVAAMAVWRMPVLARVREDNAASGKLFERLGFEEWLTEDGIRWLWLENANEPGECQV